MTDIPDPEAANGTLIQILAAQKVAMDQIKDIKPLMTMVGGRVVYQDKF